MSEQPIIIKKVKKGGHAHHGGAWKLAYADFVTAMMAFFLLMWLLGTTTEPERKGIAEYFQDPFKSSEEERGYDVGDRTSIIQAGGSDMTSQNQGQVDKGAVEKPKDLTPEEIEQKAEDIEKEKLENLKKKIQDKIDATPELTEYKDQIKLEITSEGLRILIVDAQNRPMYKLASAEAEPQIKVILKALAPVINEMPNRISINGHTDARPFPPNQKKYTNWELSSDRANAARYELTQGGLAEGKFLRVIGLSSSVPYSADTEPLNPINRRISIIVMNKKTEQEILNTSSENAAEETGKEAEPASSQE